MQGGGGGAPPELLTRPFVRLQRQAQRPQHVQGICQQACLCWKGAVRVHCERGAALFAPVARSRAGGGAAAASQPRAQRVAQTTLVGSHVGVQGAEAALPGRQQHALDDIVHHLPHASDVVRGHAVAGRGGAGPAPGCSGCGCLRCGCLRQHTGWVREELGRHGHGPGGGGRRLPLPSAVDDERKADVPREVGGEGAEVSLQGLPAGARLTHVVQQQVGARQV